MVVRMQGRVSNLHTKASEDRGVSPGLKHLDGSNAVQYIRDTEVVNNSNLTTPIRFLNSY